MSQQTAGERGHRAPYQLLCVVLIQTWHLEALCPLAKLAVADQHQTRTVGVERLDQLERLFRKEMRIIDQHRHAALAFELGQLGFHRGGIFHDVIVDPDQRASFDPQGPGEASEQHAATGSQRAIQP